MSSDLVERLRELAGELAEKWEASADDVREAADIIEKLPVTKDGVRVVPNVDPIWIDPNENEWPHDRSFGSFDDDDNYVPHPPIKVESWSHHGDHLWVLIPEDGEGDHWFGKFYSTEAAALAASPSPTQGH